MPAVDIPRAVEFLVRRLVDLLVVFGAAGAQAQIYVSVDAGAGTPIVLSNFALAETPVLLLKPVQSAVQAPASSALPDKVVTRPFMTWRASRFATLIETAASDVRIPAELIYAVIAAESNFDPAAVSPKGAIGLMQLMPSTGLRFGASNLRSPEENIRAGSLYLKWLSAMFNDDLELVLAAYNAGEQSVLRAGRRIPPYPETQAYVPRVLGYFKCLNDKACSKV